ncbi:MAG: Type 1 glutamine amidotransferase-like domain-containing protein [Candidatus Delongbacteria bacterium]|nr:Type 1 glutamine amidotransferase-like domain-containing protein [Candidatus Delongbacteria bacterium]MBN2834797.1 Type 1 glutamine amidotransferase-like domain-containing protein [Candidatus Delongbacteria bacterium]
MKNVLLTSNGLSNVNLVKHFYSILPKNIEETSLAIIMNGTNDFSKKIEKTSKRISRGKIIGFGKIDIIDLELRKPKILENYDCIEIAGGNPFILLEILKRKNVDKILINLVKEGKIIIADSGGSFILSPNLNFINYVDEKLNSEIKLLDLEALNIFPYEIFPHYDSYCEFNSGLRKASENYEKENNIKLVKINDGQAVYSTDETYKLI